MKLEDLENWFRYHRPTNEQTAKYEKIRGAAHAFALMLNEELPECADKTHAIRVVRDAVMWANASIECSPPPAHNPELEDRAQPFTWLLISLERNKRYRTRGGLRVIAVSVSAVTCVFQVIGDDITIWTGGNLQATSLKKSGFVVLGNDGGNWDIVGPW